MIYSNNKKIMEYVDNYKNYDMDLPISMDEDDLYMIDCKKKGVPIIDEPNPDNLCTLE